jgi:hypothetical protein
LEDLFTPFFLDLDPLGAAAATDFLGWFALAGVLGI